MTRRGHIFYTFYTQYIYFYIKIIKIFSFFFLKIKNKISIKIDIDKNTLQKTMIVHSTACNKNFHATQNIKNTGLYQGTLF